MRRLFLIIPAMALWSAPAVGQIPLPVDTAVTVALNIMPLSSDGTDIDETLTFDEAGIEVYWNCVLDTGATTVDAVTPTDPGMGVHDLAHVDGATYSLEIPDTGGDANNDEEGVCWATGIATGFLPFRSPEYLFTSSAEVAARYGTALQVANVTQFEGSDASDELDLLAQASVIGTPSDFGSGTSTIASNLEDMADNGTASFDRSTDSLQAVRDRGDAAWTGSGLTEWIEASGTIAASGHDTDTIDTGLDGAGFGDDWFNDKVLCLTDDSASLVYCLPIATYTEADGVAEFSPGAFPATPEASVDTFIILGLAVAPATSVWDDTDNPTRELTALDEDNTTIDLDGSNVGGIAGTITTLDGLDTAQDTQHSTTQSAVGTAQADLDIITGADGVIILSTNDGTQFTEAGGTGDQLTAITGAMALEATLGAPAAADLATDIANLHIIQSGYTGAWALGPFVSSTDHVTRVTSGTPACTRSTDAPNDSTALNGSTTISAAGAKGYSEIVFDATDTTATDYFRIDCTLSGADPLDTMFKVQQ